MTDRERPWTLVLPEGWNDAYDWAEAETRGVLMGAHLDFGGRRIPFIFYDPVRLAQDAEGETQGGLFYEPNVVVVKVLTREAVYDALDQITTYGQLDWLRQ